MILRDYIAGLFDGEGFFTMRRVRKAKGITNREWRYQCYAQIVMRERHLLEEVRDVLGYGWVSLSTPATERHAPYFGFGVTGDNLRRFCVEIGPLLRLKQKQAILVHEVCLIKRATGNQPVSDCNYERQVQIWAELRELNAKGPNRRPEQPLDRNT